MKEIAHIFFIFIKFIHRAVHIFLNAFLFVLFRQNSVEKIIVSRNKEKNALN